MHKINKTIQSVKILHKTANEPEGVTKSFVNSDTQHRELMQEIHSTSHGEFTVIIPSWQSMNNSPQCECKLLCSVQEMVEHKPPVTSPQPILATGNDRFVLCQAAVCTSSFHQSDSR